MKIHRTMLVGLVAGIAAFAVSSCAYDPYYSGGSYSSGGGNYGDGYGYGGSNFSTSFFVSTGNPRWGYDPYAGAYYDYSRRCYYDQNLYGYYPVGYRPRYVYGSPHPHGWSHGHRSIEPPSRIRSHNLTNYHDRTSRYQGLGRDWSHNVRSAPVQGRDQRSGHDGSGSNRGGNFGSGRGNGEGYTPSQDRGSRNGNSGSSGFNRSGSDAERSRGGRSSAFGGGNTSVAVPQAPSFGGGSNYERGGAAQDSGARQAMMDRMNESRRGGSERASRQMAPQVQPQPAPQRQPMPQRQAPQDDSRSRGGFQGGGSDGGGGGGGGGGRGRGVRGLGEG